MHKRDEHAHAESLSVSAFTRRKCCAKQRQQRPREGRGHATGQTNKTKEGGWSSTRLRPREPALPLKAVAHVRHTEDGGG